MTRSVAQAIFVFAVLSALPLQASAQPKYEYRRAVQGLVEARTAAPAPAPAPAPLTVALQAGGYRAWNDGSLASSCNAYLTGGASQGSAWSGIYRVQPAGQAAADVYCDMVTDGGGWTLAVRVVSGSNAHVNANAVGSLGSPLQAAPAKLSDAYINALMDASTGTMRLDAAGSPGYSNYFKVANVPFSAVGAAAVRPVSTSLNGSYVATVVNGGHGGLNSYASLPLSSYLVYGPADASDGCRIAIAGPASWCGPGGSGALYVR